MKKLIAERKDKVEYEANLVCRCQRKIWVRVCCEQKGLSALARRGEDRTGSAEHILMI